MIIQTNITSVASFCRHLIYLLVSLFLFSFQQLADESLWPQRCLWYEGENEHGMPRFSSVICHRYSFTLFPFMPLQRLVQMVCAARAGSLKSGMAVALQKGSPKVCNARCSVKDKYGWHDNIRAFHREPNHYLIDLHCMDPFMSLQLLSIHVFLCSGKYYYEVTCHDQGLCRIGWSTSQAALDLGTLLSASQSPRCITNRSNKLA